MEKRTDLRLAPQNKAGFRCSASTKLTAALRDVYAQMRTNMGSRPSVYSTPTGDAPNIVKSHSLEPEGLRLAFSISTAIHWSDKSLPWAKREMINTVTSRANNCFY